MPGQKQMTNAVAADEEEAGLRLLDEWLRIENEHTHSGLPSRADVVAWSEGHPLAVLIVAGTAVCVAVATALCFG